MFSIVGYVVFAQLFNSATEADGSPRQQVNKYV